MLKEFAWPDKYSHLQINAIKIEKVSNVALKVSAYEKRDLISEKIIDVENDYVQSERGFTF